MSDRVSCVRRSFLARAGHAVYARLLRQLRRFGFDFRRWPVALAIRDLIFDPLGTAAPYNQGFTERVDPWDYHGNPDERLRHRLAAEMLDRIRGRQKFASAIEIGCAEGTFTQFLAERCDSVLAVDFSEVAVERTAAQVASSGSVRMGLWNLRTDPWPGKFDLIVAMDVFYALPRPRDARTARAKILAAMQPRDYLLVGDHRHSPQVERAWWAKFLMRGGKWLIEGFAKNPTLECLDYVTTEKHMLALLRKK